MNKEKLGVILNEMYFNSKQRESVVMIHLFSIKFAKEIKKEAISSKALAILAKIPVSYATEISKGLKLAKYVEPK